MELLINTSKSINPRQSADISAVAKLLFEPNLFCKKNIAPLCISFSDIW